MWSGAISFGLVNVPIKLYSAVSKKTVRFHQLNGETGNRIAQKRTDSVTGEEVAYENLVKGYELTKDSYVLINPDELDALDPEKSRTIDIEDFVDLSEIDPIYYDHPYYLVPDKGATKAYGLLLNAMQESGRVAIARVVLRSKEQLVAIRPGQDGTVLMMETMIFADEVVPKADLDGLPDAEELQGLRARGPDGPAADRVAGDRLRAGALQGRVPREGARADRGQGRGRGDRLPARGADADRGAGPDGRAGGLARGGRAEEERQVRAQGAREGEGEAPSGARSASGLWHAGIRRMPETGARPNVPRLQRSVLRAIEALTTPLLPSDYLELINPLWSTRELRGRIERIEPETGDAATVVIKPGYRWDGHRPGQYLRIGVDIKGRRHWRAYSLTSEPDRADGCISITVKHVEEGVVSPYLVKHGRVGAIVSLGGVEGDFVLPGGRCPRSCCSSAPAAGSRRS